MDRLFNEKHTQPLLYEEMVERTFHLKNRGIEPAKSLNYPIICIGKQGKALFLKLHFSCHPYKLEFVNLPDRKREPDHGFYIVLYSLTYHFILTNFDLSF